MMTNCRHNMYISVPPEIVELTTCAYGVRFNASAGHTSGSKRGCRGVIQYSLGA
jgi:hypothetical protein